MRRPGKAQISAQEELERRVLHGLSCEWERALWVLGPRERGKMRPPLFGLRDLQGQWGNWSGRKREISLNRAMTLRYSWASVREVLLHEMAHQMAEEVLEGPPEPPHGPRFQRACGLLRANPRATGNYPPLDDRVLAGPSDGEDRVLLRVRKLLALAQSPDRHEAEAAMAKAHKLIARHNLDLLGSAPRREFISLLLGRAALRHFAEDYCLAHLLQDFYFVRGIWVSCYVPEKGKMGRALEVSGTLANVKMAGYVHDFIRRSISSRWAQYPGKESLSRYRLTDFAVGVIEGFRSRLEGKESGGNGPEVLALMRRGDPLLEEYVAHRYPRTVSLKTGRGGTDPRVRRDGRRVGETLVLSKGITDGPAGRGLALPP